MGIGYYLANAYNSYRVMKDGEYVISYGGTISGGALLGGAISGQIVFSGKGEKNIAISFGGGPMAGIGASGGVVASYYPEYDEISDIYGLFINAGASAVIIRGIGYDIIRDFKVDKDVGYSDSLLLGSENFFGLETIPMKAHFFRRIHFLYLTKL